MGAFKWIIVYFISLPVVLGAYMVTNRYLSEGDVDSLKNEIDLNWGKTAKVQNALEEHKRELNERLDMEFAVIRDLLKDVSGKCSFEMEEEFSGK